MYSVESVLPRPTGVPSALMLSNFKRPMVERSRHPSLPTAFCLGQRYRHRARPLSVHLSDGDASIASNWISRRRCQVELGMVWTEHKTPDNLSLQSPESPPGGLDSCRVRTPGDASQRQPLNGSLPRHSVSRQRPSIGPADIACRTGGSGLLRKSQCIQKRAFRQSLSGQQASRGAIGSADDTSGYWNSDSSAPGR